MPAPSGDWVTPARLSGIEQELASVLRTSDDVLVFQAEAVALLEAVARSIARPGIPCLNLVSGPYGRGFGIWLEQFGAEVISLEVPYDSAVAANAVEEALTQRTDIEVVALVHAESVTGTSNPVREIGPIAHERGAVVVVDAVASIGGTPLETDEWALDINVGAPHKCLGGSPGVSFASVSERAWELVRGNPAAPRDSFLSLLDWKEHWLDSDRSSVPGTPNVAEMVSLAAALDRIRSEGLDHVIARHELVARALRAGIVGLGLEPWAAEESAAATCVTTLRIPRDVPEVDFRGRAALYGAEVASGHDEMAGSLRIDHMGAGAQPSEVLTQLAALGQALLDHGHTVDVGAGVQAAATVVAAG
jgi:aspartate aminotransferase-like enzyme